MTDNEIIKALECLCGCALKCRECPYSPRYAFPSCERQVAKDTLDLITRQQAEIERYKRVIKILEKDVTAAKSEAVKDVLDEVRTARNQSLINKTSAYKIEKILEKMVGENNSYE